MAKHYSLLRNAPAAQPDATALIFAEFAEIKAQIESVRQQNRYTNQIYITGNVAQSNIIIGNENKVDSSINSLPIGQFNRLDDRTRRILSQANKTYTELLQVLTDEAKEVRAFSIYFPLIAAPSIPKPGFVKSSASSYGVNIRAAAPRFEQWRYEERRLRSRTRPRMVQEVRALFEIPDRYIGHGAPRRILHRCGKLALDETAYKLIEEQLDFGKSIIDAMIGETTATNDFMGKVDSTSLEHSVAIRGDGSALRKLHALLKAKDPGFGGLVRVMNNRQEFLWVHEKFAGEVLILKECI